MMKCNFKDQQQEQEGRQFSPMASYAEIETA